MIKFKKFQQDAIANMIKKFDERTPFILSSPTGSGKTLMLTTFINDVIDNNHLEDYAFLWIAPGKADLHIQSFEKMVKYFPKRKSQLLEEAITKGKLEPSTITFLNWESVTKVDNISLRESETNNLFDVLNNTDSKIVLIVDEQHMNATQKSSNLIDLVKPYFTAMASATEKGNSFDVIEVNREDVVASGLIKKTFVINENIPDSFADSTIVGGLIGASVKKRHIIFEEFQKMDKDINPLVLIQIPNNEQEKYEEVLLALEETGHSTKNGSVAIHLDKIKINNKDVKENQSKVNFIISKQALSTGWDAPRTSILVKLRFSKNERFNIQTIGRISRMPEAIHYENALLDNAYIYTNDDSFSKNIIDKVPLASFVEYSSIKSNPDLDFEIPIKKADTSKVGIDFESFAKSFKKFIKNQIGSAKKDFEDYNYIFSENVSQTIIRGFVDAGNINAEQLETTSVMSSMTSNLTYLYGKTAIQKLGSKIPAHYIVAKRIFDIIFDGRRGGKIIGFMSRLEYMRFFINNFKKLELLLDNYFRNSDQTRSELNLEALETNTYKFPKTIQIKAKNKNDFTNLVKHAKKSIYEIQLLSDPTFSKSEKSFSFIAENLPVIKYWFKNGDSGSVNYSIVYRKSSISNERNFFPDFIAIDKNGVTWFIETKGDDHFDDAIKMKFDSLKDEVERLNSICDRKYNFAFGKLFDDTLLFNNSKYTEDFSPEWKTAQDIIK